MSSETESLGVCPECGDKIRPAQVLIEFEADEGETNRFVKCYSCGDIVKPK